jgi:hypothetical protein
MRFLKALGWTLGHALAAVCRWPGRAFHFLTNPLTTEDNQALSLGRLCMVGFLAVQSWFVVQHPKEFMALGWPPVTLLTVINLVLLGYCFCAKPYMQQLLLALAGRVQFTGGTTVLPEAAQKVASQLLPADAAPAAAPDAAPDLKDVAPEETGDKGS